ncbi:MAG TPA: nuclease A inhibitor family protein [Pyrinomonadaceae bacterium]|nr:nuclease A inhibitor family protein [Pyrinomonadaceae bacterium]
MKTDDQLIEELEEATRGLSFMSESDYPLEVFRWEGVASLTPEFLRGLTGHDPAAPVEALSAAEFFRAAASEPEWKGGAELAAARRFQALLRLLEENLSDLKVFRVGVVNMPVYVLGRGPSGGLIGLSTRVVET